MARYKVVQSNAGVNMNFRYSSSLGAPVKSSSICIRAVRMDACTAGDALCGLDTTLRQAFENW